jgi:hypothetical protein
VRQQLNAADRRSTINDQRPKLYHTGTFPLSRTRTLSALEQAEACLHFFAE